MSTLLEIGLNNAVMAVLLAMVAALVAMRRPHPALVHGLWVLVLVKLLTPPLVPVPVPFQCPWQSVYPGRVLGAAATTLRPGDPGPWMPGDAEGRRPAMKPGISHPLAAQSRGASWYETLEAARESGAAAPASGQTGSTAAPSRPDAIALGTGLWNPAVVGGILVAVWLAGSLAWFGGSAMLTWRVCRLLAFARPAPRALQEEVRRLARRLGLQRSPEIHVVAGRIPPMVWPVGRRPKILFPQALLDQLTPEERAAVLAHELAHVRRGDGWVRVLEFVGTGLYWWHPVVWWTRGQLRRAEEECCDAWVVSTWPELARTYAAALLQTVEFLSRPGERRTLVPPIASGAGTIRLLKRRLTMIYHQGRPARLGRNGRACLLVVAALLLPVVPGPASSTTPAKAEKPKGRGSAVQEVNEATADAAKAGQAGERSGIRAYDGFDGDLALPWKPVRHDPALASLEKRPGMLTLTTHCGEIWGDIRTLAKNLFLTDNPLQDEADFVATTCLDAFQPTTPWQQAGLLVYDDDDNFLKWACEFGSLGERILLITREVRGSPLSRHIYPYPESDRIWLRLTKRGRLYEIATSTDGQVFDVHGEFPWGDGFPKQIGLMAMNGLSAEQTDAHFDFFEVRSLAGREKSGARFKERQELQGTWEPESYRLSGRPVQVAPISRLTFGDGTVTVSGEEGTSALEHSVDVTRKPRQFCLWQNRDGKTIAWRFLYSLRGDTLVVCFNPSREGPPPTRLRTEEDDGLALLTLKRMKSERSAAADDIARAVQDSPWRPEKQFDELDQDGDGQLTVEEFTVRSLHVQVQFQATDVFSLCDQDGDGKLSLREFKFRPREAVFRAMDDDGDGALTIKEYCRDKKAPVSVTAVQRIFDLLDRDGDAAMSFEEFRDRSEEAWFAILDRNEDGRLWYDEYAAGNTPLVRNGRCPLVFAVLDRNGDSALDFDEYSSKPDEAYFHKKDADGDGKLSFAEYAVWLYTPDEVAAGQKRFEERDGDGDGFLNFKEFAHRHADVDFWNMDRDADGRVSLEEFRRFHQLREANNDSESDTEPQGSAGAGPGGEGNGEAKGSPGLDNTFASRIDLNHDGLISLEEFRAQLQGE